MSTHVSSHIRTRASHAFGTRSSHDYDASVSAVSDGALAAAQQSAADGVVGPGDIPPGTVPGSVIVPGSLSSPLLFADTLRPVVIVTALPTLPDDSYPLGSPVLLTTDGKLYRTVDGLTWTASVEGSDIVTSSIVAGSISVGALASGELTADVLLAGTIETGVTGRRSVMSPGGITLYGAADEVLVNMPTDGDPVSVAGDFAAGTLAVEGNASFRGTANKLEAGSVTSLRAGISSPTAAPVLAQDWERSSWVDDATRPHGDLGSYDPAGGAGGATKVFWCVSRLMPYGTPGTAITEYRCSDLTLNRYFDPVGLDVGFSSGVARLGAYIYIVGDDGRAYPNNYSVKRYNAATLALDATYASVSFPGTAHRMPSISSDGTNIFIVDTVADGTGGRVKWCKYDASMVKIGSTIDTGFYAWYGSTVSDVLCSVTGSFDFGAWRMVLLIQGGALAVTVFDSTGARQTNNEFPVDDWGSITGITYGDVMGDGARFWTSSYSFNNGLYKHTTWTWTSASAKYWVAYSWYDSVATVHESQCGPRASITMGRRKRLTVTMPSLPVGGLGADDPDSHRVYMLPNATDPGLTALKLQSTVVPNVSALTTYASGGAADPGANNFPAATPAELKSAAGEWSLKGDGTMVLPASVLQSVSGIQTGSGTITLTGVSVGDTVVTFPVAFASAPVVMLTISGGPKISILLVAAPTASGFTARAHTGDASVATMTVTFWWLAVLV